MLASTRQVEAIVRDQSRALLSLARRHSICSDDAQDAYQRGLEIFLRRFESLEPETRISWLRTVVKHEAMAIRAARHSLLDRQEADLDVHPAPHLPSVDEHVAAADRRNRSAEALERLKPQEVRALLLKAEGHSYREISSITGWSYTKVNRCLTEGRKRFLERYQGIQSGAECERWTPLLSAVADGEATARELIEVRPHLRRCPACRARVRAFHEAPRAVAGLVPAMGLMSAPAAARRVSSTLERVYDVLVPGLHERVVLSAQKLQSALEAVSSGKVAAIAASSAALAGGGIAVDRAVERPARPAAHPVERAVRASPRREPVLVAHAPASSGVAPAAPDPSGSAARSRPDPAAGAPTRRRPVRAGRPRKRVASRSDIAQQQGEFFAPSSAVVASAHTTPSFRPASASRSSRPAARASSPPPRRTTPAARPVAARSGTEFGP